MNILESLLKTMRQPEEPPHVGEVMHLWALNTAVKESRAFCLLMVNHTNDPEVKQSVEHFIDDLEEPLAKQLETVLRNEGIPIAPPTSDKPKANERDVPPGAKLTDAEIMNLLVVKLEGMLLLCFNGLMQALRDDVAAIFLDGFQHALAQGFTLKKTMRKRGWLRVPPPYIVSKQAPGT